MTTYQALKTVEQPLKYGRCGDARETKPVQAVADDNIDAIKPYVLPEVWAMIQLQRFSGMRPSEVCQLKGEDITREKEVWIYLQWQRFFAHFFPQKPETGLFL